MEEFKLWSSQICAKYADLAFALISSVLKLITSVLPRKGLVLNYLDHDQESMFTERRTADPSKVIISLCFTNILIEYSSVARPGFVKLDVPINKSIFERLQFWKDYGYYYRKRPHCETFVRNLSQIPNVLLYLYTKQPKNIADRLLEKLHIASYIPPPNRRYREDCKIIDNQAKKHPAYLDNITTRIIILTSNLEVECDDANEASRYFLEMPYRKDDRYMIRYVQLLSDVITRNKRREQLHQELQEETLQRFQETRKYNTY